MDHSTGVLIQRTEPRTFCSQWFTIIENSSRKSNEIPQENDFYVSDTETIDESYIAAEITIRSTNLDATTPKSQMETPVYRKQYQFFYDPSATVKLKRGSTDSPEMRKPQGRKINGFQSNRIDSHDDAALQLSPIQRSHELIKGATKSEHHIIIRPENPGMGKSENKSLEVLKSMEHEKTMEQLSESLNASESQDAFENLFARYGSRTGELSDPDMDELLLAQKGINSPHPFLNRRSSLRGSTTRASQTFDKVHCYACQKPVYAFEGIHVMDRIYHKFCFRCRKCSRVLSIGNFSVGEGYPFCEQHYMELFKVRGRYDGPIQGEPIEEYNDFKIHQFAVQSSMKPDPETERPRPLLTQSLVKLFQNWSESNRTEDDGKTEEHHIKSDSLGRRSAVSSQSAETLRRGLSDVNISKSVSLSGSHDRNNQSLQDRFPRSYSSERLPAANTRTKELIAKFTAMMNTQ